ncbi:MAG TPA: hypothetical protein VFR37_23975 [Longimicrobium sp.]|nr:hypothetical protein [Longimicrobium sp.]
MRPRHLFAVVLVVPFFLAACSSGGGRRPVAGPAAGTGAMAPASAVEQFIGLAAQQRYTEMGYVFGTARGPLAEQQAPARVTRRMQAIAGVLRHDTYSMTGVQPVANRPEARRVTVQLRQGRRVVDIPFTVVQGPGGRWLVEMVDVEAAMQPRG